MADCHAREIVICPPFVDLPAAVERPQGTRIQIGGQNIYWAKEGAFTGEVSAGMLRAAGCQWVIVAHSERREYFGETEETALKKIMRRAGCRIDAHLLRRRTGWKSAKATRPMRCSDANCAAASEN